MADYKICPKCGTHNEVTSIACEKCNQDLMFVDVTEDEQDEDSLMSPTSNPQPRNNEEQKNKQGKENFQDLFNCPKTQPKPNNPTEDNSSVNVVIKPKPKGNPTQPTLAKFRYCNCGEANTATAIYCTKCNANISLIEPITKEQYQKLVSQRVQQRKKTPSTRLVNERDHVEIKPSLNQKIEIGRGVASDEGLKGILSSYEHVSRKHLIVWLQNDGLYIMDEKSTNGTFLNNKKLEKMKQYKLNIDDELVLGNPNSPNNKHYTFKVQ